MSVLIRGFMSTRGEISAMKKEANTRKNLRKRKRDETSSKESEDSLNAEQLKCDRYSTNGETIEERQNMKDDTSDLNGGGGGSGSGGGGIVDGNEIDKRRIEKIGVDKERKVTRVVKIRRKNGVVVQPCDVYIGRAWNCGGWKLKKSKWSNPFTVKKCGSAKAAVEKYREYILQRPDLMNSLHELDGNILGCWCKQNPNDSCHGDVLVELIELQKQKENQEMGVKSQRSNVQDSCNLQASSITKSKE